MNGLTDEQLVFEVREHADEGCAGELVSRHIGRVRGMVFGMVLNDADADELTQEVFLRVLRNLHRFKGRARFSTWLFRITVNTVRGFRRREARRQASVPLDGHDHADGRAGPDRVAAAREDDRRVRAALERLRPGLRRALVLTVMEGMSVEEAARAEGCVKATMYWRVHQARKVLKAELSRDEYEEHAGG